MKIKTFLDFLPTNFRHEKSFFVQNNLTDFEKLSNLSDLDINEIQRKSSICTLNNLKKIRAIAIFKKEIGISPPQAYLLLHCGISSIKSLSLSTPYELERKIGRLESDNDFIEDIPQCKSRYAWGGEIPISFLKIAIALIFFRLFNVHNEDFL